MANRDITKTHIGDIELNHHLQRQILLKFLRSDKRTYSELLIDGMSGNSFLYHLKALLREKLIVKTPDHTYHISPLGKLVLDSIAFDSSRFLLRPTIGLFLVARDTSSNKIMLYESSRQPFIHRVGFLFGKMLIGHSYQDLLHYMTKRRSIDAFGIDGTSAINIVYKEAGETISHRTGVIMQINVNSHKPDRTTEAGNTIWRDIDDKTLRLLPEIKDALPLIGTPSIELSYDLN